MIGRGMPPTVFRTSPPTPGPTHVTHPTHHPVQTPLTMDW